MPQIQFKSINFPKGIEIYFWKIEETPQQLRLLLQDQDLVMKDLSNKRYSYKRQLEKLSTRVLLLSTLHKDCIISHKDTGQPYFVNSNNYISISHTKDIVTIAISKVPVGIDIEYKRHMEYNLGNLFLNENELQEYVSTRNHSEELLSLWTVKEAAYKFAPNKAKVLREIIVCDRNVESDILQSVVSYPDGSSARCYTYTINELVISICVCLSPSLT